MGGIFSTLNYYLVEEEKEEELEPVRKIRKLKGSFTKTNNTIQELHTIIAQKDNEIQILNNRYLFFKSSLKSIFVDGLPPMKAESIISSARSHSPRNRDLVLVDKEFIVPTVDLPDMVKGVSLIWSVFNTKSELLYATEDCIKHFVMHVVSECVNAIKLGGVISILSEIEILGDRPDIWLIFSGNTPVGVIKVKKPGNFLNDSHILGQSFDYLNILANFYGIKHPFCILSTYIEWRVVWLPSDESNCYVLNSIPLSMEPSNSVSKPIDNLLNDTPVFNSDEFSESSLDERTEISLPRAVNVSQIVHYTDKTLAMWLCTIIQKMYYCPKLPVSLISSSQIYIKLTGDTLLWEKLPSGVISKGINFSFPSDRSKNFYLIKDLRGGLHGRVWLAVSGSGNLVVLKFPKINSDDVCFCLY